MKMMRILAVGGLLAAGLWGLAGEGLRAQTAPSPYQQKVWRYVPAPGQFIDAKMLTEADTDSTALAALDEAAVCAFLTEKMAGKNNGRLLSLGSYGGYVVLGFDHRIPNGEGLDLRLYGNAYYAPGHGADSETPGGSAEPGIVYVSRDDNGDGLPNDTWYEISGSETDNPQTVNDYRIVYYRPTPLDDDVFWRDNQGDSGYVYRNTYHTQDSYYPWWMPGDSLVFSGRRLPDNAVDEGEDGKQSWFFRAFDFGYADNHPNNSEGALVDIDWAIDAAGRPVALDSIDFVKIVTGVRQNTGWTGEVSTEVAGVEDVHCLTVTANAADRLAGRRDAWRVYPNPCTDVLQVAGGAALLRLYDAQGRCVGARMLAADAPLVWEVSDLKPGLYLLEVRAFEPAAGRPVPDGSAFGCNEPDLSPVYYKILKQ